MGGEGVWEEEEEEEEEEGRGQHGGTDWTTKNNKEMNTSPSRSFSSKGIFENRKAK